MRLLDVHSVTEDRLPIFHELHEDGPSSPLRYAILSHTWGKRQENKEIVFDDIPSSETFAKFLDEATQLKQWQGAILKKKVGFSKITNACRVARELGLNYIWIDSCCIDKSKSAELNESINSMYRWYKDSEQCIVYLEDLDPHGDLKRCRWFRRGWTLQELVAPERAGFYDRNWIWLGEKSDRPWCEWLPAITGIDKDCLRGRVKLASLSIAHKMSWAYGRETTGPEDSAYSLIGIFDVNMPLMYGEGGTKAFRRLQEEIARVSSDLSIFAWDPSSNANAGLDAFASRPDEFTPYKTMVPSYQSQHFTRTNKGIEMETILWRVLCEDGLERLMLAIGKQSNSERDIGIILRKVGHNMYMRHGSMRSFSDVQITSCTRRSTFYLVSSHISTGYDQILNTSRKLAILIPRSGLGNFYTGRQAPEYAWDCEDRLFFNNRHWGGSDWRAIELIKRGPAGNCDRHFVALFSLKDTAPDCYLLPWGEASAVIFDRRHQTETTRQKDFRHVFDRATNEVDIESNGARLSIRLIPIADKYFGMQFRMELRELPSCEPGSATSSSVQSLPSQLPGFAQNQAGEGRFVASMNSLPMPNELPQFNGLSQCIGPTIPPPVVFGSQLDELYANLSTSETFCVPRLQHTPQTHHQAAMPEAFLRPDISKSIFKVVRQLGQKVFSQSQGTGITLSRKTQTHIKPERSRHTKTWMEVSVRPQGIDLSLSQIQDTLAGVAPSQPPPSIPFAALVNTTPPITLVESTQLDADEA